jgi:hypothetical protein
MRLALAIVSLVLIACFSAFTQNTVAQDFFNRVHKNVREDFQRAPRYTCVQTITRVQYRPQYPTRPNSCPALIAERARLPGPGVVVWRDRLRFDVAVGDKGEMFSWAGATQFDSGDAGGLALSGSTGSGDFATFLGAVFGADAEQFHYLGNKQTPLGLLEAFDFKVPQRKSHYTYKSQDRPSRVIGYQGTFFADPETAQLKRLIVDTAEFPRGDPFCHVTDTMDYGRIRIGQGDFLLPNSASMVILYSNGEESHNDKRYSGCREFTGTSTLKFDEDDEAGTPSAAARAALKALPSKTRIRVKIDPPIDSATAAAGDQIVGVVEREVRQKGEVLVRTTDRLHGRILRFEEFIVPTMNWVVAIRFDTIERDGVEQPLVFDPVDDGDRTTARPSFGRRTPPGLQLPERPKNGGIFVFTNSGKLVLDKNFHSEWRTR